jgi:hypothetical protein
MIYLHLIFKSTVAGVHESYKFPFVDPDQVGAKEAVRLMSLTSERLLSELRRVPLLAAIPSAVQSLVQSVDSGENPKEFNARIVRIIDGKELVEIQPNRLFGGAVLMYTPTEYDRSAGLVALFWFGPEGSEHALDRLEWMKCLGIFNEDRPMTFREALSLSS